MIDGIIPLSFEYSSIVEIKTIESLIMIPVIPISPTIVNIDIGTSQMKCP